MNGDRTSCFVSFPGRNTDRRSSEPWLLRPSILRARPSHAPWAHLYCGTYAAEVIRGPGMGGKVLPSRTVTRRFSVLVLRAANPARVNLLASRAQPSTSLPGEQFPPGWARELRQGSAF